MARIQLLLATALAVGGFGLAGCERETADDGARFEVEVDRPREEGTLDRMGEDIRRGTERTGEEIERGIDRTGDEIDRATDTRRD